MNSLMLSLCNIYLPNNQFLQELNNCLIEKSELTTLIVGGDWNCTLSKNDKIGGKPWKASNYKNLVLTTMDILDLMDIQRERHPKLRKCSYESKALKVKSRIDFFFGRQKLDTIRQKEWSLSLYSAWPQSNLHVIVCLMKHLEDADFGNFIIFCWTMNTMSIKYAKYIFKLVFITPS